MISNFIDRAEAIVVADVLHNVAELRKAADTAQRLRRGQPGKWAIVAIEAQDRADAYVRELTERIASRARSGGMKTNDAISLAEAVLDKRRRLPAGVEVLEVA